MSQCRNPRTGAFASCHGLRGLHGLAGTKAAHTHRAEAHARNLRRYIADAQAALASPDTTQGRLLAIYTSVVSLNAKLACQEREVEPGYSLFMKDHQAAIRVQTQLARRLDALH